MHECNLIFSFPTATSRHETDLRDICRQRHFHHNLLDHSTSFENSSQMETLSHVITYNLPHLHQDHIQVTSHITSVAQRLVFECQHLCKAVTRFLQGPTSLNSKWRTVHVHFWHDHQVSVYTVIVQVKCIVNARHMSLDSGQFEKCATDSKTGATIHWTAASQQNAEWSRIVAGNPSIVYWCRG